MKQLLILTTVMSGEIFSPDGTRTGKYDNLNLNAIGSGYAQLGGRGTTTHIGRVVRQAIYDSFPQQYLDLLILNMKQAEQVGSDEFFYHEAGFGREAITIGTIGSNISAGATQTVPVTNLSAVSKDIIVLYPDGATRGTVTAIDAAASTITISAEQGKTLPLLATTNSGKTFAFLSPVEADSAESFSTYFRLDTIERSNYVQMLAMAHKIGKMEYHKYKNSKTLSSLLEKEKERMFLQMKVSLSNIYWNGNKAEVKLADGTPAKTAGGILPIMKLAGSPNSSVTLTNAPAALEELILDTEYGKYGQRRFLYGTPRAIHYLTQKYKASLTRYAPNDMVAKLGLNSIDIGSSSIVFVPMKRFEEASCFSPDWRSRLILLDQENIVPKYALPEESGTLINRSNGGSSNAITTWVSATASIEFNNPLASGWLDLTDLP